jgi:adenylate kinase
MKLVLIAVALPGAGKSTLLSNFEGDYISRDLLKTDSKYLKAIRESGSDVLLLDKCHHNIKSRNEVLKQLPKDCDIIWLLFEHPEGIDEGAKICIERCKKRGDKNAHLIVNTVKKYWQEPVENNIIRINMLMRPEEILSLVMDTVNK